MTLGESLRGSNGRYLHVREQILDLERQRYPENKFCGGAAANRL